MSVSAIFRPWRQGPQCCAAETKSTRSRHAGLVFSGIADARRKHDRLLEQGASPAWRRDAGLAGRASQWRWPPGTTGLRIGSLLPCPIHLRDLPELQLAGRSIAVANHCYGCTAGQGSNCGGALSGAV
ncbi:MAG: DUF3641 domain-containing protein [Rhodocyclaceae bacterium]